MKASYQADIKLKGLLSDQELGFLREYRRLEDLEREKGIKFFECIGDPPTEKVYVEDVETKRQNFVQGNLK